MRFKIFGAALLVLALMAANAFSDDISQGDTVSIVTPGEAARLCPAPKCEDDEKLTHIPEGTRMEIEGIMNVKSGMRDAMWFEVRYKGERGWISIYDTDKAR